MAILQSRMIALINAATDYQNAYRQALKMIHQANKEVQEAPVHEREELAKAWILNLILRCNEDNLMQDAAKSQATITGEHYRYSMNKKRNEWNRKYQEKRRGGITTKHHVEPDYATTDFSIIAAKITPFRSEGQNQKGHTPKVDTDGIEYIPGELSAERKAQLDREIERSFNPNADIIPKGKDPFKEED